VLLLTNPSCSPWEGVRPNMAPLTDGRVMLQVVAPPCKVASRLWLLVKRVVA